MTEVNIVEQCLEPLACSDESITSDRALLVQTSIAVSLKRIADALHGDDQSTGMKHALAEIANRAYHGWGPSS